MKTFKSFKALANELREVQKVVLPETYAVILDRFGIEAMRDAKEDIIGVTSPFQGAVNPWGGKSFGPWAAHSPSTIAIKSQFGRGKGGDPYTYLYDTGEMYESIEYTVTGITMVSVGSNSDHAVKSEYGDGVIDPRPFLGPAIIRTALKQKASIQKLFGEALSWGA